MAAKSIMIQGTMSNVGKSLITAGLCRIFHQDGYRVAPFKSQNMALNSFVTSDGLEMGRAQVMQAEAAGTDPEVRMNPILLKPSSDMGSQVIVNGEILGDMDARKYFEYKNSLRPKVMEAYRSLAEDFDIIVLEGAGSPAEINLKSEDLVNMGMAEMSGSPVLLVGDIDRGGVFAQLYGTYMLLTERERAFVKGLVINKFRGDKTILDPGIDMLFERLPVEVVGTVPYMKLDIDDEDSLADRLEKRGKNKASDVKLRLGVVRVPHMANFTDFNALSDLPETDFFYIEKPEEIHDLDMLLLPGTKNTMGDMAWLREKGFYEKIHEYYRAGGVVFGICGGYQMLGEELNDPYGVEQGVSGSERGLGLLPVKTVFTNEKRRCQMKGRVLELKGLFSGLSGMGIEGYEIHMGRTVNLEQGDQMVQAGDSEQGDQMVQAGDSEQGGQMVQAADSVQGLQMGYAVNLNQGIQRAVSIENPRTGEKVLDGFAAERVFGTYLHGFFDAPGVAWQMGEILARRKGMSLRKPLIEPGTLAYKSQQYDMLADTLRKYMDIEAIYRILEEGIRA